MTKIITVLKLGGEYNEGHVEWLQRQIKEPIHCLTDSTIQMKDVTTVPILHNFPGWWSKLELFRGDIGTFLYLDLDTVVLSHIPDEWRELNHSVLLKNVAGQRHLNSALMYIREQDQAPLWKSFFANSEHMMKIYKTRGDEGPLNEIFHPQQNQETRLWQNLFPGQIISYKENYLKTKSLDGVKVVLFHGQPRPWKVNYAWVPKLI